MNPALIYQSTAEMSVWHKMQSVSSADFNCFGFFYFLILNFKLMVISAQMPQQFFYITNFSKLSFTASGRCATWNILSGLRAECQIMMSTNGLQDRGRKTEGERDKWTTRECLQGRERQERCLHLLIHAERTCLCLWALGDVLKAAVMNAALFSHTSLISASLSAILLSADPGRAVSLFTLVVVQKMSGIKNKFAVPTAQIFPEKENPALINCQVQTCLEMYVLMQWCVSPTTIKKKKILILTCYISGIPWFLNCDPTANNDQLERMRIILTPFSK